MKFSLSGLSGLFSPPVAALIALLAAAGALATAYISQYAFGFFPCELCHWQRVPLWIAVGIATVTLLSGRKSGLATLFIALLAVCFAVEAGIASYHIGVEQHWWAGTGACTAAADIGDSAADLRAKLLGTPVARCDEISWTFLGLSMATWNLPFSLGLLALMLGSLFKGTLFRGRK